MPAPQVAFGEPISWSSCLRPDEVSRRERETGDLVAYDQSTVDRVRLLLASHSDVDEKRIVGGGLGFMVDGHLCCGVSSRGLTVRVGRDEMDEVLSLPHVRPLAFGGRTTKAFVVVEPDGYRDDEALRSWIDRGLRAVDALG